MSALRDSAALQRFGKPPGRVMFGVQILAAFVGLIGVNVAGSLFFVLIGIAWIFVAIAVIWLARLVVSTVINRRFPRQKRWLAVPTLLAISLLVVSFGSDKHLVLRIARPWIEHDVKQLLATTTVAKDLPLSGWLGPLPVNDVQRVGDTLYFQVAGTGFVDRYGYAWSPTMPAISSSHPNSRPLTGNWWEWHWEF